MYRQKKALGAGSSLTAGKLVIMNGVAYSLHFLRQLNPATHVRVSQHALGLAISTGIRQHALGLDNMQ